MTLKHGGPPDAAAVARALPALKRSGCSVLLVGSTAHGQHRACRRLCGSVSAREPHESAPKVIVHVRTDGPVPEGDGSTGAAGVRIVDDPPSPGDRGSARPPEVDGVDPAALADRVEAELADHAGDDPCRPGELRVCVDTLRPLCTGVAETAVRSFVERVDEAVTARNGMVHWHLPGTLASAPEWLPSTFDVVVRLRGAGGDCSWRWRLPGDDERTEWVEL